MKFFKLLFIPGLIVLLFSCGQEEMLDVTPATAPSPKSDIQNNETRLFDYPIWFPFQNRNLLCGNIIFHPVGNQSHTAEIEGLGLYAVNNDTGYSINVEFGVSCVQIYTGTDTY